MHSTLIMLRVQNKGVHPNIKVIQPNYTIFETDFVIKWEWNKYVECVTCDTPFTLLLLCDVPHICFRLYFTTEK